MIDQSAPGTWRAALAPDGFCRSCGQVVCDHPDALYLGLEARASGSQGERTPAIGGASPTVRRECGFDAVKGGPDSRPAVCVSLHDGFNSPTKEHDLER